jgi:hypothetical protein
MHLGFRLGNNEGKRPRGNTGYRWDIEIKINLKGIN